MMRYTFAAALGIAWLALSDNAAFGQTAYPYNRPNYGPFSNRAQLSPYLNLARPGNPAVNYFLGTIPEQDRRYNERAVQSSLLNLEGRLESPPQSDDLLTPLAGTGHATSFGSFGTYFGQGPRVNAVNLPGVYAPPQQRRR